MQTPLRPITACVIGATGLVPGLTNDPAQAPFPLPGGVARELR